VPEIKYIATPTAAAFHKSSKFFRCIKGPVGASKSVTCVMELVIKSMQQAAGPDGVRRTRWVCVRNTYPELKTTTVKTFQDWVPDEVCPIVYDIPHRGTFKQSLPDGTKMEAEFLFLAIEGPDDVRKLLSLEVTGGWLNEASQLDEEVFTFLRGRVGRFPSKMHGGPTWSGIVADLNPPKTTHWIYKLFEQESNPEFQLFDCPPAVFFDSTLQQWKVNPDAENLSNLPVGYYDQQIAGAGDDYIRVMLAGEYGMTRHGKLVFPQYSEREHVAKEPMKPDRGLPLIIGFDFGLNPSAIFSQLGRRGRLCILDALTPADEDLESFCDEYVLPLIQRKYNGFAIQCVGDPSARGRSGIDKRTPFDVLASRGLRCVPALTNNFVPRKEAVDYFLNRRDGFIVCPTVTYVREAFGGGYVFEKLKGVLAGSGRMHKEKPVKNEWSHGMDAIQYICLYIKAGSGAMRAGKLLSGMGNDNTEQEKKFLWA
jgi:Phage terminase large subunit